MNEVASHFEMPPEKMAVHRRAVRLEWLSIAYFVTAVTAVYLVLGSSQALKAAWIEDMLAFLPPLAFLVAARIRRRAPGLGQPTSHERMGEDNLARRRSHSRRRASRSCDGVGGGEEKSRCYSEHSFGYH